MTFIHFPVTGAFSHDYHHLLHVVRDGGRVVDRHGGRHSSQSLTSYTREVTAVIEFQDPTRTLVTGTGRKMSTKLAAVEALQLLGGFHDPERLRAAVPGFEKFFDGGSQRGAYGPRVGWQLEKVRQILEEDPASRRAIVQIWDPTDLPVEGSNDYPCTIGMQFMIRHGALETHVSMRSNDVWRGVPYDCFMFAQVHCTMARLLGVAIGTYYHHAASLHIYAADIDASRVVTYAKNQPAIQGINAVECGSWNQVTRIAHRLHYDDALDADSSESWLKEHAQP